MQALSCRHGALLPLFTAARAAALIRWLMGKDATRTPAAQQWCADTLRWPRMRWHP